MKSCRIFGLLLASLLSVAFVPGAVLAAEKIDVVVYSGYYSRQGNDGKMAEMSGKSHYMKFYPNNRVIRLYIPYPYSKQIPAGTISKLFTAADKKSSGSAYIRDTFGLLEKPIIAHLDVYRRINGEIMFDCGSSAPCQIEFDDGFLKIIKRGIVKDHVIRYDHVNQ